MRQYSGPEPDCGPERDWTFLMLQWQATGSNGTNYDRISAVWLSGVEVLRTCTAEARQEGVVWTVEKDITRFAVLFKSPQLLVLELENLVNENYMGIYNVTLSIHFYIGGESKASYSQESYGGIADMILPFAKTSSFSSGYWFHLQNESDVQTQRIQLPNNAYRAVLEVCVSFHGSDEFWYSNPPNTLTGLGNSTFREVLISIDGLLAGVVYPFPVIYTGGWNPGLWSPISAIGSFVLPSYDVDITPFLGKLINFPCSFTMTVANALPYWLIGANLHVWLDPLGSTSGALVDHSAPPLQLHTTSTFDGTLYKSEATRLLSYKGQLTSVLFGNLTTTVFYSFKFSNTLTFSNDGYNQGVHQEIESEAKVVVTDSRDFDLVHQHKILKFPLNITTEQTDQNFRVQIEHAWVEEEQVQSKVGLGFTVFTVLHNEQQAKGDSNVATKQRYALESSDGCYVRSVGANDYTLLYDLCDRSCTAITTMSTVTAAFAAFDPVRDFKLYRACTPLAHSDTGLTKQPGPGAAAAPEEFRPRN